MKKKILLLVWLSPLLRVSTSLAAPQNIVGWEVGTRAEASSTAGTQSVQSAVKRSGTYSFLVNPTTVDLGYAVIACLSGSGEAANCDFPDSYFRFYFQYTTAPAANDEVIFRVDNAAAANKFELRLTSGLVLQSYTGTPTLMDTGSTQLAPGVFYNITCYVPTGVSVSYYCLLDGVTELSSSGRNFTSSNSRSFIVGKRSNRNSNTVVYYYDDIALDDAAPPPNGAVLRLIPSGDGSTQQWTLGTGASDYTSVNQVVANDLTYVRNAASANQLALFTFPTTGSVGISGNVYAVKTWVRARENTAVVSDFRVQLKSGATSDSSSGVDMSTAAQDFGKIYPTDPNTGSTWTLPAIDSLEVGCLEVNAVQDRCTQVTTMVDSNPTRSGSSFLMMGVGG